MGGGIWEQTNLGGVKVGGDSCGRQATFRMCRRLRFLQLIDDFVEGKASLCLGRKAKFAEMVSGESVFYFVICSVAAPPRDFAVEEGGVVGIVQGGVLGLEVRDGFWQVE